MPSRPYIVACLTLAACGPEVGETEPAVVRTDSAGVEIVDNILSSSMLPLDSVAETPVLIIGADPGDAVLYRVSSLALLPEDRLAVGAAGANTVYVFDASGRLAMSLGRDGVGPGEFRGIYSVFVIPPDSLAVFDSRSGRLTVFGDDGEVRRTVDVARYLPPARGARIHHLEDGFALIGNASIGSPRAPGIYRDSAGAYRLNARGDSIAYLGRFPGTATGRSEGLFGLLPFGAFSFSAVSGQRLIIGDSAIPQLLEFSASGSLLRIIRWPDHSRDVSDARAEAFLEFQLAATPEGDRSTFAARYRDFPRAPSAPAWHDLVVAPNGVIWVGDYPGPESFTSSPPLRSRRWTLFGPDGGQRLRVVTPPGFDVMAVRGGIAYGVHRNEWAVETVRAYAVPDA